MVTRYNATFVVLSVIVAIVASYVALEFSTVLAKAEVRWRALWLACGALAMGFGIWSMHFVGMLAFEMPGMTMAYDIPLMLLSIWIAVAASWLALYLVSRPEVRFPALVAGGLAMAAAICGMHYTGMISMRMAAVIEWNYWLVAASFLVALFASFSALAIALRIRYRPELEWQKGLASVLMGFAIAGMHYTGMIAATFRHTGVEPGSDAGLIATDALGAAVMAATIVILGMALASSGVERALSRRSRLYEDAARAVAELERERELRDRFLSALAHDLRTPLTAAKMSAQLGMRKSSEREAVEKHCGKTVESLERIDKMIQDMLDAYRIAAGKKLTLTTQACAVKDFLHAALEDLTTAYGKRFELACPESLQAEWDLDAMRRAVENLCTNAVKYGRPNSPITVRVREDSGCAEIQVHNEGNPIPEEERKRLFGLFHRGSAKDVSGRTGWGLGLTIVKGIAEAHGGRAKVESGPEGGTTFTIRVPLRAGVEGLSA